MSDFCPQPDPWDDAEPEEQRYPPRPVESSYARAGVEPRVRPVHRTLDPQTALDRLVRRWALVAVIWLATATIAGLRGIDLTVGVAVCLVFFVIGAARLR